MRSRTAVGEVKTLVTPSSYEPPDRLRAGVVDRAFEGDRGAAGEEWCVHDVAVAHDPADVGGGPPDVVRAQAEADPAHRVDVHAVAAVDVDGELRARGRAGRREDEGGLVRLDRHRLAARAMGERDEVLPPQVAPRLERRRVVSAPEHDDVLDRAAGERERAVHDLLEPELLPLAPGDVGGEDRARAARLDPIRERLRAEAGAHDAVDGADPDR